MTHARTKVRATIKIGSIHLLTVDLGWTVCATHFAISISFGPLSLFLFLDWLLYHASEIRRLIRTAAPFIAGYLRIRAKRACARRRRLRIRALPFRGDDHLRRDALFHPAFERQRQIVLRMRLVSS